MQAAPTPTCTLKTLHTYRSLELRQRLRAAREEAGVTQQDLAHKLYKPQSYVSKYETGERRLDVTEFIEVCEALDVDATEVLKELIAQPTVPHRRKRVSPKSD